MNASLPMRRFVPALAVLGLAAACGESPPPPATGPSLVQGPCADVYGGTVCTWAEVQGDEIVQVGATVPLATIQNAPEEMEMSWPPVAAATIPLPDIAIAKTGVRNFKVYWEAHGHPPGPYLVPHFDFHFYTISADETNAIDCSDLSKPARLPAGYALPDVEIPGLGNLVGVCVPEMGMHSLLASELESDTPFTGTMVAGYYSGKSIFIEPMLTRDLLLQEKTFSLDVPTVENVAAGVVMPSHFEAQWDAAASAYRFVFTGFPSGSAAN